MNCFIQLHRNEIYDAVARIVAHTADNLPITEAGDPMQHIAITDLAYPSLDIFIDQALDIIAASVSDRLTSVNRGAQSIAFTFSLPASFKIVLLDNLRINLFDIVSNYAVSCWLKLVNEQLGNSYEQKVGTLLHQLTLSIFSHQRPQR
ncbi:MAG: hypothetical protein ACI4AM_06430 [Muribaculaceae bacterium]